MQTIPEESLPPTGLTNKLLYPVNFSYSLGGVEHKAAITHIENNYVQFIYHIDINEGCRKFFTEGETGIWMQEGIGPTELAAAIGDGLAKAIHLF